MKDFPMPDSTAAAVFGAKALGFKVIAGVAATAMAFAVMWPKTAKEGFARMVCTIGSSTLFGGGLHGAVNNFAPFLIEAGEYGAMPIYAAAGLPGWWLLGAIVLWFRKRSGQDIGEMYVDARKVFKNKP